MWWFCVPNRISLKKVDLNTIWEKLRIFFNIYAMFQTSSFGYPDPSLLIFTSSYIAPGFPPLAPDLGWGLIIVWVLIHEWRDEIPSSIPWASSLPSPAPLVLFFGAFPPAFAPFFRIVILREEEKKMKNEKKTCRAMYKICYTQFTKTEKTAD